MRWSEWLLVRSIFAKLNHDLELGMLHCTQCNAADATCNSYGRLIEGGNGYFDKATLVWLDRRQYVEGPICENCLVDRTTQGAVETIDEPGMFERGQKPSFEAYMAAFEVGANRIRQSFHELNGSRIYSSRNLTDESYREIIELRSQLSGDDTFSVISYSEHQRPGTLALLVGQSHAISAIALGHGEEDPGFRLASERWATKRIEVDRILRRSRENT